jgi:hypothetical protein
VAGLRAAPHPRLWVELGLARMAALDRVVTLSQLMGQEPAHLPAPSVAAAPNAAPPAADKKKNPELKPPDRREQPLEEPVDPEASREMPGPADEPPPPSPVPDFSDVPEDVAEVAAAPELPDDDAEHDEERDMGDDLGGVPSSGISAGSVSSSEGRTWILAEMPAAWADLVEDYALDKPFTSSPLRHSRLDHEDGEPATLEVTFAGEHYHDLFLSDGENRKSLREFLARRLAPGTQFTLAFSGGDVGGEGAAPAPIRTIHPAASAQAVLEEEPGVRKLIEVFEGRLID